MSHQNTLDWSLMSFQYLNSRWAALFSLMLCNKLPFCFKAHALFFCLHSSVKRLPANAGSLQKAGEVVQSCRSHHKGVGTMSEWWRDWIVSPCVLCYFSLSRGPFLKIPDNSLGLISIFLNAFLPITGVVLGQCFRSSNCRDFEI